MHRTPIPAVPNTPHSIRRLARRYAIADTSSSPEARVYALSTKGADEDAVNDALFVKAAAAGALAHEAHMDAAFHELGLGPEVIEYLSGDDAHTDWLVTRAVIGDDCTNAHYLAEPERLCDLLAERLRALHELFHVKHERIAELDIPDVRTEYLENVERGWRSGHSMRSFSQQSPPTTHIASPPKPQANCIRRTPPW